MDIISLLYDHYKETYSLHLKAKRKRDTAFIILCIGITFLFCFLIDPVDVFNSVYEMIKGQFSLVLPFKSIVFQSFVWVMVLYFFIRYFQASIYIERLYKYIEELESCISKEVKINFDRESKNYENNYPLILNIMHIIYFWIFPIITIIIIGLKICFEIISKINILSIIFDSIIALIIIVLNVFYLLFLNKK